MQSAQTKRGRMGVNLTDPAMKRVAILAPWVPSVTRKQQFSLALD
jgi:hypothetical protein